MARAYDQIPEFKSSVYDSHLKYTSDPVLDELLQDLMRCVSVLMDKAGIETITFSPSEYMTREQAVLTQDIDQQYVDVQSAEDLYPTKIPGIAEKLYTLQMGYQTGYRPRKKDNPIPDTKHEVRVRRGLDEQGE